MKSKIGKDIYNFGQKIWPYNRSITGEGTLNTLNDISDKEKYEKLIFLNNKLNNYLNKL